MRREQDNCDGNAKLDQQTFKADLKKEEEERKEKEEGRKNRNNKVKTRTRMLEKKLGKMVFSALTSI